MKLLNKIPRIRLLLLAILIASTVYGVHIVYFRARIDQKMMEAMSHLPSQPMLAYKVFLPILTYSNWLTLGWAETATEDFVEQLHLSTSRAFQLRPLNAHVFVQAEQTIDVLRDLEMRTDLDVSQQRNLIIHAARVTVPSIKESGTLTTWQAMEQFFLSLRAADLMPADQFGDVDQWFASLNQVSHRPLGIRDVQARIASDFREAMRALDLSELAIEDRILLRIEGNRTSRALIAADQHLLSALNTIAYFIDNFNESTVPPELAPAFVTLLYNRAVLRFDHLHKQGDLAQRMGSDFIAYSMIKPDDTVIPPTDILYQRFIEAIYMEFRNLRKLTETELEVPEPSRTLLLALILRNEVSLADRLDIQDPTLSRQATDLIQQVAARPDYRLPELTDRPGSPYLLTRLLD